MPSSNLIYIWYIYMTSTRRNPQFAIRRTRLVDVRPKLLIEIKITIALTICKLAVSVFLAHLSTKCSWWAIVVSGCPSSVVVRRATCVVLRPSTFDVYTLETTFVIQSFWNFVRIFVLTISRSSSNMGHVGSKTRSPGQILGNSCLHSRGNICYPILLKLCQNVCFDNI